MTANPSTDESERLIAEARSRYHEWAGRIQPGPKTSPAFMSAEEILKALADKLETAVAEVKAARGRAIEAAAKRVLLIGADWTADGDDRKAAACEYLARDLRALQPTEAPAEPRAERYQHYKGGIYTVIIDKAHIEADERLVVVYRSEVDGQVWVRPYTEFHEDTMHAGKCVKRFTLLPTGDAAEGGA